MKSNSLLEINKRLFEARSQNNGRIPHNIVAKIVESSKTSFPWLTRNVINALFKKYLLNYHISIQTIMIETNTTSPIINNLTPPDCKEAAIVLASLFNQNKGGRPKQTAKAKKKFMQMATIAFRNEVATHYRKEKNQHPNHRLKKERFEEIVSEISLLRNIPNKVIIKQSIIQR